MPLRYGGIFSKRFISNFLLMSVLVKEICKSVKIGEDMEKSYQSCFLLRGTLRFYRASA